MRSHLYRIILSMAILVTVCACGKYQNMDQGAAVEELFSIRLLREIPSACLEDKERLDRIQRAEFLLSNAAIDEMLFLISADLVKSTDNDDYLVVYYFGGRYIGGELVVNNNGHMVSFPLGDLTERDARNARIVRVLLPISSDAESSLIIRSFVHIRRKHEISNIIPVCFY